MNGHLLFFNLTQPSKLGVLDLHISFGQELNCQIDWLHRASRALDGLTIETANKRLIMIWIGKLLT